MAKTSLLEREGLELQYVKENITERYGDHRFEDSPVNRTSERSCDGGRAQRMRKRSEVYDKILSEWKAAAPAVTPHPRSSHARVLGGQALRRRRQASVQHDEDRARAPSWGYNPPVVRDTISPASQSNWKKQFLHRQLSRLSGIPMAVLVRHNRREKPSRVYNASLHLTSRQMAEAIVQGKCDEISRDLFAEKLGKTKEGLGVDNEQGITFPSASHCSRRTREPHGEKPLPSRGFHVADLHALVRNFVEWRHCLPKVEPCFEVKNKRDSIVLGLVHALGGRLSCSSPHDVIASAEAARRGNSVPAPHLRLFDRHVCRSPELLLTSLTSGVELYEVDSADEVERIASISRKMRTAKSRRGDAVDSGVHDPKAREELPIEVMIRLASPRRETELNPATSNVRTREAEHSVNLEASYGATIDEVEAIVRLTSLPIVGFSIDVGTACYEDSTRGGSTIRTQGQSSLGQTVPQEMTASASLAADIERAVSNAAAAATRAALAIPVRGQNALARATRGSSSFTFHRLHVSGLDRGGACREPLAALKTALARHVSAPGRFCPTQDDAKPIIVSADATGHLMANGVWSTVTSILGRKDVMPTRDQAFVDPEDRDHVRSDHSSMYFVDDGCYGSLSAALMRGVRLQPSPLLGHRLRWSVDRGCTSANTKGPNAQSVSCIVWGPTCDSLDCVSRMATLPQHLEPGCDWLFFQDLGMEGDADPTYFNGFAALDAVYCVRQKDAVEASFRSWYPLPAEPIAA